MSNGKHKTIYKIIHFKIVITLMSSTSLNGTAQRVKQKYKSALFTFYLLFNPLATCDDNNDDVVEFLKI